MLIKLVISYEKYFVENTTKASASNSSTTENETTERLNRYVIILKSSILLWSSYKDVIKVVVLPAYHKNVLHKLKLKNKHVLNIAITYIVERTPLSTCVPAYFYTSG